MESQEAVYDPETVQKELDLEPWEREVDGMYRAIQLVDQKARGEIRHGFDGSDVLAIHKAVLNDPLNPHFSGVLRKAKVKMGFTVRGIYREADFIPLDPQELPELFKDFSDQLRQRTESITQNSDFSAIVDTATWAHQSLIRIHPFIDGNGRAARLLVDLIFKRAGLPYITDWGARNDQYKDIVDRSFRENNEGLFKKLLAEKLLVSIRRLEREGLVEEVSQLKSEVSTYLERSNETLQFSLQKN